MTIWPALANFEENEKGSLEINKAAYMIVLDKDILDENQKEILKTKVIYTIIDGEIVYQN